MEEKNENKSIIPIIHNSLIKVGNSISITNKLLERQVKKELVTVFKSIKIGDQIWMTKNLNVDCYRNGDQIPKIINDKEWGNLKTGAWRHYNNNPEMDEIYGKEYNWYAVNDVRGLAPKTWHIPSAEEWDTLIYYLGGGDIAFAKMKAIGGDTLTLDSKNTSDFEALPMYGGIILYWSATGFGDTNALFLSLKTNHPTQSWIYSLGKTGGVVVRCLQDQTI